ncbi:MAG: sulfite exporter TauE/SafE family protein [Acetobacteraceae bacterium]|nr:sulfite exporter TauE/SafE family protein [Acetobacteraceae bacterium]
MATDFLTLMAVGFMAQLVDGALGMAFGVIASATLLVVGLPPAQASAAVHAAEIATTGASGLSHLLHRNVDRRLLLALGVFGVLGGITGAWILSNIDGWTIRPFVNIYLLLVGAAILVRAIRDSRRDRPTSPGLAAPLGFVGGLLDAVGGGGWGPLVTSSLIGSGHAPRKVIGTVNTAEFFVTVAISTTFLLQLGAQHVPTVLALMAGGVLAAPLGAALVRHLRPRLLMAMVGTLVCALSLVQLATYPWRS